MVENIVKPTTTRLLEEEDPEAEPAADLGDDYADFSSPFHGFPSFPVRVSTPIDFGQLLDDPSIPGEDGAIGGREEMPAPINTTAASLAEQSEFYSALLDKVECFTEGAEQALQAVQALDPESQLQVEEQIRKKGRELQDQLNWAEITFRTRLSNLFEQLGPDELLTELRHQGRLLHLDLLLHPSATTTMLPRTPTGGRDTEDDYDPLPVHHSRFSLLLLIISLLALPDPRTEAKEAVISEQIGQMAGVTAYLHIHVELSISSVEAQQNKYYTLLKQHFNKHEAAMTYMKKYLQSNYTYEQKMHIFDDRPENLPNGSLIRGYIGQWVRIARLHLKDVDDMR